MSALPMLKQENLSGEALRAAVREAVDGTPAFDCGTGLFPLPFGRHSRWGIDELLTTSTLALEVVADGRIAAAEFAKMPQVQRADVVWESLFLDCSPISNARLEVVAALSAFGLDVRRSNLAQARAYFDNAQPDKYIDDLLRIANVEGIVFGTDPLDLNESAVWLAGGFGDSRFRAGLRLDPIFDSLPSSCFRLKTMGYDVTDDLKRNSLAELRRYVDEWSRKTSAVNLQLFLSGPLLEGSAPSRILQEVVLPACKDGRMPLFLSLGPASWGPRFGGLLELLDDLPTVASTICPGSIADAADLASYLQFGLCLDSGTGMTLATSVGLGGASRASLCSAATVFDQLIGRWKLLRAAACKALSDRYQALADFGRPIERTEIYRDVATMLNAGRNGAGNAVS